MVRARINGRYSLSELVHDIDFGEHQLYTGLLAKSI
jgi:hypothetical protein